LEYKEEKSLKFFNRALNNILFIVKTLIRKKWGIVLQNPDYIEVEVLRIENQEKVAKKERNQFLKLDLLVKEMVQMSQLKLIT
jgi:hypothetical protein